MCSTQNPPRFVRLLDLLKEHNLEYLSGQDLSDVLKISRIAVWKHVEKLRTLGYIIESDKTHGYKLTALADAAYPWELEGIKTKMLGKNAYYFDTISSTQDYAIEMAKDSTKKGTLVVAGEQSAGRGRGKNSWTSPKGGLWFSVILDNFQGFEHTLFPIATAVVLVDSIQEVLNASTKIKWPNDLLIKGNKVAGIINDAILDSGTISHAVLGIGINYNIKTDQIRKKANREDITVLHGNCKQVELIENFLFKLENAISSMSKDGGKDIVKRWERSSDTIGSKVTAESEGNKVQGTAIRLDLDGALVLKDGSSTHRIISGMID